MRLFAFLHRRFHWINLPGALLMVLLQRTPVLSLFASAEEVLGAGTAGVVLKSGLATLAALGAVNTLVGATPLVPSSGTAAGISVTGSPVSVFYTVNGTQTPPMSWEVNGSIPPGLDFSGLTIPGTVNVGSLHLEGTPTANGTYNVTLQTFQLTNGGGFGSPIYAYTITVTGVSATSPPSFTTQPASQTVTAGTSVTFTAAASGTPAPAYQWQKGGVNIAGATNSSYSIASAAAGDAGSYTVVATNSAGTATSNAATLTVSAASSAPSFTTQPASKSVAVGSAVTFTAAASGNPTPTYQWQKDGAAIAGATNSSYSIASAAAGDAGSYTVVATNSVGTATSNTATLSLTAAAPTTVNGVTATVGHNASFSTGHVTGSIQWQVSTNGGSSWSNLGNDSTYAGATTSLLTVTSVTTAMNGAQYRYVLTTNGVVATSNGAALAVAQAFFPFPTGIAVDPAGNLYVSDANADTVQKVNPSGQVSLLAGASGATGTADGMGAAAKFNQPAGVMLLPAGAIVVTDSANATLRSVASDGTVTTLAGQAGTRGGADGSGNAASFSLPTGLAVTKDGTGTLYVADAMNDTIRKVTSGGAVTTLAGSTGATGSANGNGGTARFNYPTGVVVDGNGNVFVADTTNNTIRQITPAADVSTLAGLPGVSGFDDGTGIHALFNQPGGLVADSSGNLYLADTGNSTIRKITPSGVVTTLAGTPGIAGLEDGNGGAALFNQPKDLALDSSGNLFVADTGNAAIRKIAPDGTVTTLALSALPAPTPTPTPTPAPTTGGYGGGGSGGGGGGAASLWFTSLLSLLYLARHGRRRRRT